MEDKSQKTVDAELRPANPADNFLAGTQIQARRKDTSAGVLKWIVFLFLGAAVLYALYIGTFAPVSFNPFAAFRSSSASEKLKKETPRETAAPVPSGSAAIGKLTIQAAANTLRIMHGEKELYSLTLDRAPSKWYAAVNDPYRPVQSPTGNPFEPELAELGANDHLVNLRKADGTLIAPEAKTFLLFPFFSAERRTIGIAEGDTANGGSLRITFIDSTDGRTAKIYLNQPQFPEWLDNSGYPPLYGVLAPISIAEGGAEIKQNIVAQVFSLSGNEYKRDDQKKDEVYKRLAQRFEPTEPHLQALKAAYPDPGMRHPVAASVLQRLLPYCFYARRAGMFEELRRVAQSLPAEVVGAFNRDPDLALPVSAAEASQPLQAGAAETTYRPLPAQTASEERPAAQELKEEPPSPTAQPETQPAEPAAEPERSSPDEWAIDVGKKESTQQSATVPELPREKSSAETPAPPVRDVKAEFESARAAANRGNFSAARTTWERLAQAGHAPSQTRLGLLYARGDGVRKDYAEAARWFKAAAAQGDSLAMLKLGKMHYYGDGVERNRDEALRLLRRAASEGEREAQGFLSDIEGAR